MTVILESDRLIFRAHEPGDWDAYCAMEKDADVRRYVGGGPRTREAAEARFQAMLQQVTDRLAMWATVLKANGSYVGRCGIYPHFQGETAIPGEGVLAFYIARPYWGQGLATEAGAAFIRFGFGELGLDKIVATVQAENRASLRVLEKLGFSPTQIERIEHTPRSFHHFQLLPPEKEP